jgi:hypothetical protein
VDELRLEDLKWVTSWSDPNMSANEESILVLDLQSLDPDASGAAEFLRWAESKATVVGFGDCKKIELAKAKLALFDVSFLLRPDCVKDDTALQYVYNRLAEVYEPFRRVGEQFLPKDCLEEDVPVVPVEPEVYAYSHPPFELGSEQLHELLELASRPETEERLE